MARISEYIFYNINESMLYFDFYGMRFYFTSSLNMVKFKKGYMNYIQEQQQKLVHRYQINIDFKYFLMIAYYKKVEHRGFRITFNKMPINDSTIKLNFNV